MLAMPKTPSRSATTAPRFAALLGLLVVFAGLAVFIAGLSRLQKTTNALGPAVNQPAGSGESYTTVFISALVTPYPANHGFQFAFFWFIIAFNLFNVVLVAAIIGIPRKTYLGRSAALTLSSIATTLTINIVNSLQSLRTNQAAWNFYSQVDLNVAFAGALVVVIANFLVIISLGIWQPRTVNPNGNLHNQNRGANFSAL